MKINKFISSATLVVASTFCSNSMAAITSENDQAKLNLFFSASNAKGDAGIYIPPLPDITLLSAKMTAPSSCNGDVGFAMVDAFTDGTLKRIYENFEGVLKELASPGGMIYLASLYVSKSNPSLYQLLTEGINIGITDFLSAMGSCEAMANAINENLLEPSAEMEQKSKLGAIIEKNAASINETWGDMKVDDVIKDGAEKLAKEGYDIFGFMKGGENQPPIDMIESTLSMGWCIYRGYGEKECKDWKKKNPNKLIDESANQSNIIDTPTALNYAGVTLLGNSYISVCKGCETVKQGEKEVMDYLNYVQKYYTTKINNLSYKDISKIEAKDYKSVSYAGAIVADANYFRNLAVLENDVKIHDQYVQGWAFDLAYLEVVNILNTLEVTLKAVEVTEDMKSSGLDAEVGRMIDSVDMKRTELASFVETNNYRPRMYVVALLRVADRVSRGESILGADGDAL